MFSFHNSKPLKLPAGFFFELNDAPLPRELNRLLSQSNLESYSFKKLALALTNSFCNLSILEENTLKLVGFVRITTDKGLNANLWDLVAEPGHYQQQFLSVLINQSLVIIRRELPGCSVSVAAPSFALRALREEGFIIDPGGIRTMAYRIR